MNEMVDTKCLLCGAPAVVKITDKPHFVGSDNTPTRISYEYKPRKPKPPVITPTDVTLHGYSLDMLRWVAALLHQHGLTPEDLLDLKNNIDRAFVMAAETQRREMERQLAAFQERCMDPNAYLQIKWPKVNPYINKKEEIHEPPT